jgi:hypothetical protein
MRAIYLFPALLGACLVLLGSSVSLQAQDGATPPDSTEAPIDPIDPIDGQPPQGPNNPPQPPANPDICGVVVDPKFVCENPYPFPRTWLVNVKCKDRGRCGTMDKVTGNHPCIARNQWFEEYVGETGRVEYEQVQAAPNGPNKKLYSDDTKVCYVIYDCETECVRLKGSLTCVRKDKPRVTADFHEFKIKGDCPAQPPNPNPELPKSEVGPDLD